MKKTLIALAVASACVASAAQADSSNVVIYGQANASVDLTKTGTDTAGNAGANQTKVSSNQSRIGFKGMEDLGNGMAANFQVEEGFDIDGGASATTGSTLTSRNTYVGLSGKSWGEFRLGRHDTPYKIATRNLDVFADTMGDNRNIMGQPLFDIRANNMGAYMSPNMSGFQALVAYVAGAESATSGATKGDAWSLAGIYANGPLFGSLAYQTFKLGTAGSGAIVTTLIPTAIGADAGKTVKATKVGMGYNFGDAKVGFAYEHITDDLTTHIDRNNWTLNGAYTMGSNVLKAAYTHAGKVGSVNDTAAKQWTLGVDHNLSKRTAVYALYSKVSNDSAGTYGVGTGVAGGAVAAVGAGADPSAWSFGMKHSF